MPADILPFAPDKRAKSAFSRQNGNKGKLPAKLLSVLLEGPADAPVDLECVESILDELSLEQQ